MFICLFCLFFLTASAAWRSSQLNRTLESCLCKAPPVPEGRGLSGWMPIMRTCRWQSARPPLRREAPPLWYTRENEWSIRSSSDLLFCSDSWERRWEMLKGALVCLDVIKSFWCLNQTKQVFFAVASKFKFVWKGKRHFSPLHFEKLGFCFCTLEMMLTCLHHLNHN